MTMLWITSRLWHFMLDLFQLQITRLHLEEVFIFVTQKYSKLRNKKLEKFKIYSN
jgi:hypothetical protein